MDPVGWVVADDEEWGTELQRAVFQAADNLVHLGRLMQDGLYTLQLDVGRSREDATVEVAECPLEKFPF